ncbi:MAG: hypothetical protein H7A51_15285 [Akkermansiaceae bacterium]|nr:hypothetical protein [Akkermansiaceae bacterium]
MLRIFAITLVSVVLCIQLVLLPTRGFIHQYFGKDRPFLKLPVASNGGRYGCHARGITELSYNQEGKWVSRGKHAMDDTQVTPYLRSLVQQQEARGYTPIIRLRIPAKTPAKHFIRMTRYAGDAGIENVLLAVWKPHPYPPK